MAARDWVMRVSRSCPSACAKMGWWMVRVMWPGRGSRALRGMMEYAPFMVTGTTGMESSVASM